MSSPLSARARASQSGGRAVAVGVADADAAGDPVGVGLAVDRGFTHPAIAPTPAMPARRRKRRRSITAGSRACERTYLIHGGRVLERAQITEVSLSEIRAADHAAQDL